MPIKHAKTSGIADGSDASLVRPQSDWNADHIGMSIDDMARAYRITSAQSIPNNTWTKVQLNGESFDTKNHFDSATNFRFTAAEAGYYLGAAAAVIVAATDGGLLGLSIYKNGVAATDTYIKPGGAGDAGIGLSFALQLAANDYIEMWVYQNCGAAKDLAYIEGWRLTWFFIARIG